MKSIVDFLKEELVDQASKTINDIFVIFRKTGYSEYDARDLISNRYQDYHRLVKSLEIHFPNDYIEYYGIIFTTTKDILILAKLLLT